MPDIDIVFYGNLMLWYNNIIILVRDIREGEIMKKAYECKGKLLKDGHIEIPDEIKEQIKNNKNLKLIILAEEQDENTNIEQRIKALENISNILSGEEIDKFDEIISERVKFSRGELNL